MNTNIPNERERSAERPAREWSGKDAPADEPLDEPLGTADLAAAGTPRPRQDAQQSGQPETPRRAEDRRALDRGDERRIEADDRYGDDDRSDEDDGLEGDDGLDGDRSRATAQAAPERERLEPLFSAELANEYRSRWIALQGSFVDDPRKAVQQGDQLVAQVMKSLAQTFADERAGLEDDLAQTGDASTEALRVALRRYRSFFDRLLSL